MSCNYFQVQMSNWTFCHTSHNKILFALWFKITFQHDFVVIINFLYCQVQMSKSNLLPHISQQNPVRSLKNDFVVTDHKHSNKNILFFSINATIIENIILNCNHMFNILATNFNLISVSANAQSSFQVRWQSW